MAGLEKSVYNKLSIWTTIYYAYSYYSWEMGSKEVYKKTDIKNFSAAYIKKYKIG